MNWKTSEGRFVCTERSVVSWSCWVGLLPAIAILADRPSSGVTVEARLLRSTVHDLCTIVSLSQQCSALQDQHKPQYALQVKGHSRLLLCCMLRLASVLRLRFAKSELLCWAPVSCSEAGSQEPQALALSSLTQRTLHPHVAHVLCIAPGLRRYACVLTRQTVRNSSCRCALSPRLLLCN